jgi:hypothetical protein
MMIDVRRAGLFGSRAPGTFSALGMLVADAADSMTFFFFGKSVRGF